MKHHTLPLLGVLILAPALAPAETADKAAAQVRPDRDAHAQGADASPPATAAPPSRGSTAAAPAKAKDQAGGGQDAKGKDRPKAGESAKSGPQDQATAPPAQPVVDPATAAAATATATAYLNAVKDQGFAGAASYLHPSALARFKTLALPRLKDEAARGSRALLNATFGRTADYATAATADPADFLVRFGRVISVREPDAAPRFSTLAPIGVLREDERLHVLVRLNPPATAAAGGPAPVERLEVVTLLAQGSEWKVDLDSRLQSVAVNLGGHAPATPGLRPAQPRFEPIPEGQAPAPPPGAPQGPANLPPMPRQPPAHP